MSEREQIVAWLRADAEQLFADAKYLHSHGSGAATELFDKATHNLRILRAIERGDHLPQPPSIEE